MSKKIFDLHGVITIDGISAINKAIKDVTKEARVSMREFTKLGHTIEKVGLSMAKISTGIVLVGTAITKVSADFENAMQETYAVTDNLTDGLKNDMKEATRNVARNSKFMAKEVGNAMFWMGSAGYKAQEQIKLLPIVTDFATAGLLNLSEATDFLIGSQNALGMKTDDVNENLKSMTLIADTLTKANNVAFGSVRDFSEALTNKAAAAMRLYNIPLHEGVAALAVYAMQNKKGKEAGESYAIVIRDMQRAAISNAQAFKKQGIAVFDVNGNFRSMSDILQQLETRMMGMNDINRRVLFNLLGFQDKSISATMALMGTSQQMKQFEQQFANLNGETKKVSETMMQSFSNQLLQLKNRFIDLGISLGEDLLPFLRDDIMPILEIGIQKLKEMIKAFHNTDPDIKKAILNFGALFVTLSPIVLVIGKILASLAQFKIVFSVLIRFVGVLGSIGSAAIAVVASLGMVMSEIINLAKNSKKIARERARDAEAEALQIERMQTKSKLIEADKQRRINLMIAANKRLHAINKSMSQEKLEIEEAELKRLKEKSEFNQSYAEKLLELEGDEIALNKKKWNEALKEAKEKGGDIHQVNMYYSMLEDNIRAKVRDKYKSENEERLKEQKKLLDDLNTEYKVFNNDELAILDAELEKKLNMFEGNEEAQFKILEMYFAKRKLLHEKEIEQEKNDNLKKKENFRQTYDMIAGFVLNIASSISSLMMNSVENWKKETEANIDQTYEKEKQAIESSVLSESAKKVKLEKLEKKHTNKKAEFEEEYIARKRKAQRAAAIAERANAIISSIIGTSVAVVKSLPNVVLAGIVGALGAIQTGFIVAQPIPELASGALVQKRRGGIQAVIGEGNQDEVVFPLETGIEQMATRLVNKLSDMGSVAGRTPFAGSVNTSATNNNSQVHLHVGTLIGNEAGYKELQRVLEPYFISENQRKGL